MSNNKIYTEEQLLNTIEAIRDYIKNYPEKFHESMIEKHLKNLTPIELPSDEEMSVRALKTISELNPKLIENEEAFYIAGFVECAKWMRDKIQGGNNEQQ